MFEELRNVYDEGLSSFYIKEGNFAAIFIFPVVCEFLYAVILNIQRNYH